MKINLFIPEKIEQINSETGRRYKTPNGDIYPSVSTVIGATENKTAILEWRATVGDSVADEITQKATKRGSLLHLCIENQILGKPSPLTIFHTEEQNMFNSVLPVISDIEEVICLETPLWSDKLKVAGTVDCVAKHKGEWKVIDWKTSRTFKTKESIPGYFKQTAAYAAMVHERAGLTCPKVLIAMMTQDDGLLVFEEPTLPWLRQFREARLAYDQK